MCVSREITRSSRANEQSSKDSQMAVGGMKNHSVFVG